MSAVITVPCLECGNQASVKQELDLFDEVVEELRCSRCRCVYHRRDGIHWFPVVGGNEPRSEK